MQSKHIHLQQPHSLVYTQLVYANLHMKHERKPWSKHWVCLAPISCHRACVSQLFLNYPCLIFTGISIDYSCADGHGAAKRITCSQPHTIRFVQIPEPIALFHYQKAQQREWIHPRVSGKKYQACTNANPIWNSWIDQDPRNMCPVPHGSRSGNRWKMEE
jgi:hypothetical protein